MPSSAPKKNPATTRNSDIAQVFATALLFTVALVRDLDDAFPPRLRAAAARSAPSARLRRARCKADRALVGERDRTVGDPDSRFGLDNIALFIPQVPIKFDRGSIDLSDDAGAFLAFGKLRRCLSQKMTVVRARTCVIMVTASSLAKPSPGSTSNRRSDHPDPAPVQPDDTLTDRRVASSRVPAESSSDIGERLSSPTNGPGACRKPGTQADPVKDPQIRNTVNHRNDRGEARFDRPAPRFHRRR